MPVLSVVHRELGALGLVEALVLADADHGAGIGTVACALQRHLVHDRRAVDQPADRADIRPGERRIVEDGAVLGLARMQRLYHLLAAGAERLGRRIEIEAVPRLVLNLCAPTGLAPGRRRGRYPVSLRQPTNAHPLA